MNTHKGHVFIDVISLSSADALEDFIVGYENSLFEQA
jgi:hypothetical protein